MKAILIVGFVLLPAMLTAQEPTSAPKKTITFAVSTVKPSKDTGGMNFLYTQSGLSISNVTLDVVIRNAYEVEDNQLLNLPDWAKTARYDIEAKVEEEDRETLKRLAFPERTAMARALLADRFHLKTHAETRELPVLNLVVAKGGPKLKLYQAGEQGTGNHGIRMSRGALHAADCSMELLTRTLSMLTHHLIVDRTGLAPHYDFDLMYTDENAPASVETTAPSIYTALQEQLGLRLDATKAAMPVIVVDRIDRPTED